MNRLLLSIISLFGAVGLVSCDPPSVIEEPIAVTAVTLNQKTASLLKGATLTLVATIAPENAVDKRVTWSVDRPDVVKVELGVVTALSAGVATVTVKSQNGDKSATCVVTVTTQSVPVASVALSKNKISLVKGNTETLVVTIAPEGATNKAVAWSSADKAIATVDQAGVVTAVAAGETQIEVKSVDGAKTATCKVIVTNSAVSVSGVSLDATTKSIVAGADFVLVATIAPANATNDEVEWSSDNATVATVDAMGKVSAISAGTAKIMVKTKDGAKTETCTVTVTSVVIPVTGISLNVSTKSIQEGGIFTLVATVSPANATNQDVEWSSSNHAVATVSDAGVVTTLSDGTAFITAIIKGGSHTATCQVTVTATPVIATSVSLDATTKSIEDGGNFTLVATVNPANATDKGVEWSSDNATVATVDATGKVVAVAVGTAVITVTTKDGLHTATCTVTVTAVPVTGVGVNKAETTIVVGGTETLIATVMPNNATTKGVTWSSNATNVATVDQDGVVTAVGVGEAIIKATAKGDSGKKAACAVTVNAAP